MNTRIEVPSHDDEAPDAPEWAARLRTPLVVFGALLLALLVALLAVAEIVLSQSAGAASPAAWSAPLAQMEDALGRGDLAAARRLWPTARAAALRSPDWEAMLAIGDAALRFGTGAAERDAPARAREACLAALLRARGDRFLEGVLRAGEAFHALGDHEMAEQALGFAERLAGPSDTARLPHAAERWTEPVAEARRWMPRR